MVEYTFIIVREGKEVCMSDGAAMFCATDSVAFLTTRSAERKM